MNEQLSQFLQILLSSIVAAAVPVLTAVVVRWFNAKIAEAKSAIPTDLMTQIQIVAQMVVMAAEQSGLANSLLQEGEQKKEWAMAQGAAMLQQYLGLNMNLEKLGDDFWRAVLLGLDAAIETEVLNLPGTQGTVGFRR